MTNLAQLALRENKIDEARNLLYQSLQVNPDYCLTHFLLGSIYQRETNHPRAAEEFRKSVSGTCTTNVQGHYALGLSYLKLKDYKKARSEFVYLMEHHPDSTHARMAGDQLRNIP
jgi:Tfp pilus assembly protein PilF